MRSCIVITGQTATGKTRRALEEAQKRGGVLISCDSRQVYKELNIITGKDIPKGSTFIHEHTLGTYDIGFYEIEGVRLYLLDVLNPDKPFSSNDYIQCVKYIVDNIISPIAIPIIVGGTYLYLSHLLYGLDTATISPDWNMRKKLKNETIERLADRLKALDEELYNKLNHSDCHNPQRLMRKIEIASHRRKGDRREKTTPFLTAQKFIGLRFLHRDTLRRAIERRVERRIAYDAIEEVRTLLSRGYSPADPGLATLGYTQLIPHVRGKTTREEAIGAWITAEMQYAKRQYTFMKTDKNIVWEEI